MASDNNSILSQEEIDAMIQGGAAGTASPEPVSEAVEPEPPPQASQPVAEQPPAAVSQPVPVQQVSAAPGVSQETIDGLTGSLKAAIERITSLETAMSETNASVMQIYHEFKQMTDQLQLVSSRVEGVMANLKATLGYRAQKTFTCGSCQASHQVAAKVKCTSCGDENWWGWWSQEG